MKNYLARLFIAKIAVDGGYGISALEVTRPFFVQGYISACGDAL
jgi:hypothetical protein